MVHSPARLPVRTPLSTCSLMLAGATNGTVVGGVAVEATVVRDECVVGVVVACVAVVPWRSTIHPTTTTTAITKTALPVCIPPEPPPGARLGWFIWPVLLRPVVRRSGSGAAGPGDDAVYGSPTGRTLPLHR